MFNTNPRKSRLRLRGHGVEVSHRVTTFFVEVEHISNIFLQYQAGRYRICPYDHVTRKDVYKPMSKEENFYVLALRLS